ncbi:plasmid recombination protein, partial [Desulfovibrio sp. OttesenSCG-928-I05]|nr:plasmid recombination protein [Desulfovibrio sp. OttesenSCG-928-I05]
MPFAVLRIQKLKTWGAIAGAGKHNQRQRETPNADADKISTNQHLVGASGMDNISAIKSAIGAQRIRKNAVLGVELLLSASPEYFRPDAPERPGTYDNSRLEEWKTASMNWLNKKYENRIVSAVLHLDEATPHLHILLAPLDDKGKLNCRSLFGGTRHTLSKLQSEYGEAVSALGISRGIQNSRASHQKVSQFYSLAQSKE